jgi:hypothetical protein
MQKKLTPTKIVSMNEVIAKCMGWVKKERDENEFYYLMENCVLILILMDVAQWVSQFYTTVSNLLTN